MEEAIEASKRSDLVKELLSSYPDMKATARLEERNGESFWIVGWWTEDRIESELPYPDALVYVDAQTGEILWDIIPKGSSFPNPIFCAITASPTHIDITKEKSTTITVTLSPTSSNERIVIEYSEADGEQWNLLSSGYINATGQYSCVWPLPKAGTYQVRAQWLGQNEGGISPVIKIEGVGSNPLAEFPNVLLISIAVLGLTITLLLLLRFRLLRLKKPHEILPYN